mmetsp:Transcript_37196/g.81640  ORF Transcript_37196/g.81640 Transcript_37196/m.81640 type:complete len:756 (+) Transcript_37196:105-2372(+)|eukprot:CAMPEP_0170581726 /NCGR_PEP_ID=MMETSP0224-20130122/7197_1 /TAXON_ID=285029 /ORGANISM="Togula jolla, Strain CCCM 725" /LENGTH=755 /DNA_ID=CAMNT_0010904889 /DNA_START=23 /DNA_END=2290 /DNA_ORIENTATION=+
MTFRCRRRSRGDKVLARHSKLALCGIAAPTVGFVAFGARPRQAAPAAPPREAVSDDGALADAKYAERPLEILEASHGRPGMGAGAFVAPLAVVPLVAAGLRRQRRRGVQLQATPYPEGKYDPDSAAEFWAERPLSVLTRAAELFSSSVGFGARLLLDRQLGKAEANEVTRARELTDLLTQLGPTFIKIGQALSIRADLLPVAYLKALTELQDRVPPVPTEQADAIMESELGQPIGQVFAEISPKPIASASLGQVYRARLRDGREVAVKVQRPGMTEVVALDLYLLRLGANPLSNLLSLLGPLRTDLLGLVDAWGLGFVGELDYLQEAANAEQFQAAISKTPLASVVCAPPIVREFSTRLVLTTEWILGERLEKSTAKDVTKLCSVAMNAYLTMLLELDVLHADPHPGNLLRMPDGKLCILDWGLITTVSKDRQITFIEHVAHLVSRDYEPLPDDLVKLGFVPEGQEQAIAQSEVVTVLARLYGQWTDGGGAAKINVNKFLSELQVLGSKYGSIFRVPPYFFYIARAFAVLEGIGLTNDPEYSIVSECLPYVSQRLLSDPSPRAAKALETFVYGRKSHDKQIDVSKVEYLVDGFSSFSTATGGLATGSLEREAGRVADQLAVLLLEEPAGKSGEPTPFQEILIQEIAKIIGAGARSSFASSPFGRSDSSPSWRGTLLPNDSDKKVLASAQRLSALAEPKMRAMLDDFRALPLEVQLRVAQQVGSRAWTYRGAAAKLGGRLMMSLMAQGLMRVRDTL